MGYIQATQSMQNISSKTSEVNNITVETPGCVLHLTFTLGNIFKQCLLDRNNVRLCNVPSF